MLVYINDNRKLQENTKRILGFNTNNINKYVSTYNADIVLNYSLKHVIFIQEDIIDNLLKFRHSLINMTF